MAQAGAPLISGRRTEIDQLRAFLRGPPGRLLELRGAPGSGRHTLLRAVLQSEFGDLQADLSQGRPRGWLWLDAHPLRRRPNLRMLAHRWGWGRAGPPTAQEALHHLDILDTFPITLVVDAAGPQAWQAGELPVAAGQARTIALTQPGDLADGFADELVLLGPLADEHAADLLAIPEAFPGAAQHSPAILAALAGRPWLIKLAAGQLQRVAQEQGSAGLDRWRSRLLAAGQQADQWILQSSFADLSPPAQAMALALAAAGGEHHPQWVDAPLGRALQNDAAAELSQSGWLSSDPTELILGRLALPLCQWLEQRDEFPRYTAALARHLTLGVLQRVEQWPARARLSGLRRRLPWLFAYLAQGSPAVAGLLLEHADGLLLEAGLAEEVLCAAEELLAVSEPGSPVHAQALLPLARANRLMLQPELAEAWLSEARQELRFAPCSAPDEPRPCRSRYADTQSGQAVDLEAWLASSDAVELPIDAAPLETEPALSERWLVARLRLLRPLPSRAERQAAVSVEQALQQRAGGHAAESWQLLEHSLPVLRQLPRLDDRARAVSLVAQARHQIGQLHGAQELFAEEALLWQRCEQALAQALALHRQAMALAAGGALHKAVDADRRSRQALQRWQRVGDAGETRLLARAQLLLGQALATRGENDEARQSLQQSVELCRKIEAGPEDPVLQAALLALARLADG
jgi:hypothetical protein